MASAGVTVALLQDELARSHVMGEIKRVLNEDTAVVAIIDDDLQNPPSEIVTLLNKAITGQFDVVYARYQIKQHSVIRNFYSEIQGIQLKTH